LRDIDALRAAIAKFETAHGPTLALVNNAARDDRHTIEEVTPEYWDDRMATNLRHQFFAAQAVLPAMRKRKRGSIVNVGSISWRLALGGMPAYVTAKAAVEGLTRGLARDVGGDSIRVNSVIPGWIMTERQVKLWLTPESEADLMAKQCLKEKLFPQDVSRMVLWLAADDSRMATAQSFVVDGGWA
jgi:NAD(P)-dependent dehydrogenase (short-subunit alcohol dehydrogenase family)